MTKKRSKFKTAIIVFLVLAGIGAVMDLAGLSEDTTQNDIAQEENVVEESVKEETEETRETESVAVEDIDTTVRDIVIDVIGETNNMDNDTISKLQINDYQSTEIEGDKIVIAKLNASDNLTINMMKTKILSDSTDILKGLFEIEDISEVVLNWDFPLVDQYGNTEMNTIISLALDKETANKINWENFYGDNLKDVGKDYFEHPAIKEQ